MTHTTRPESQQAFSFMLKSIDILEKSFKVFKKDKKLDYDYGIALEIAPNPQINQSFHLMTVSVSPKGQEKEILATLRLGFVFEIANLEQIVVVQDNNITLPPGLLNLLNAVVIGTMRGVLFSELRGTMLEDAILPVLDPSKFEREAT